MCPGRYGYHKCMRFLCKFVLPHSIKYCHVHHSLNENKQSYAGHPVPKMDLACPVQGTPFPEWERRVPRGAQYSPNRNGVPRATRADPRMGMECPARGTPFPKWKRGLPWSWRMHFVLQNHNLNNRGNYQSWCQGRRSLRLMAESPARGTPFLQWGRCVPWSRRLHFGQQNQNLDSYVILFLPAGRLRCSEGTIWAGAGNARSLGLMANTHACSTLCFSLLSHLQPTKHVLHLSLIHI